MRKQRLFFITLVMAVFVMIFGIITCSAASSGVCGDNVTWVLDDNGKLTVSGTGPMSIDPYLLFESNEEIKEMVIENGVTSIEDYEFFNCRNLTRVTIPGSVTSIGRSAFDNCVSLTDAAISDGVKSIGEYAFGSCIQLREITIPGSVDSIGNNAFTICSSLKSVTILDGVNSIGSSAFSDCSNLSVVSIPGSVASVGMQSFSGCTSLKNITIGEGVKSIGDYAFGGCSSLTDITIPDSVTEIGLQSFVNCTGLERVTLGNGVTSIGESAFYYCRKLTDINLPDSLTAIGKNAFGDCSSLTNIMIPGSVTAIGEGAFEGCENLKEVFYEGTSKMWKSIELGQYNDTLTRLLRIDRPVLTKASLSGTKVTLSWTGVSKAASYDVYRGESENGKYTKIASAGRSAAYSQSIPRGKTYYYKIKANYAGGDSEFSNALSQYAVKKGKARALTRNKLKFDDWAGRGDDAYLFSDGGKLYSVGVNSKGRLLICTLNSKLSVTKTKTLKLPKKSTFCGFYHGIDDNNYVVVCYSNPKESKTKTVFQVIRYNSKWKKTGTASIKGGASNSFEGIYSPVAAGSLRMDMQGKTLYIHTCRTMFIHSDGLHHQSNIEFAVNTRTMKARATEDSYVSHSFDQYVRFKDGTLYLLDLGDGYPRALTLKRIANWGKGAEYENGERFSLFEFMGDTGDNYTGTDVGGMEIGARNIIAAGTSVPHHRAVKGVTGFRNRSYNLYVTVTDKETGKTRHKWLTNYNPKKSTGVGYARIVKLSDYRFAVLCTIKGRLHYYAIDNNGNIKVHKKYAKKYDFNQNEQPVLFNGNIIWTKSVYTNNNKIKTKLYSIPAL